MDPNDGGLEDDFSFSIGWLLHSMIIFQGMLGKPTQQLTPSSTKILSLSTTTLSASAWAASKVSCQKKSHQFFTGHLKDSSFSMPLLWNSWASRNWKFWNLYLTIFQWSLNNFRIISCDGLVFEWVFPDLRMIFEESLNDCVTWNGFWMIW